MLTNGVSEALRMFKNPTSHPHLKEYSQLTVVLRALYAVHSYADVLNLHRDLIHNRIMLLVPNSAFDHTFLFQLALYYETTPIKCHCATCRLRLLLVRLYTKSTSKLVA